MDPKQTNKVDTIHAVFNFESGLLFQRNILENIGKNKLPKKAWTGALASGYDWNKNRNGAK